MKGNNQRQGGWIASFVIVGAVLVLGLVGGVYYLKNRTSQAATVTPEPVAKQDSSKDKSSDKSDDKKQSSESAQSGESSANSEANKQDEDEATLPSSGQSSASDTTNAPAALPQTGPADAMVTATLVTLVAFAVGAYIQSRKAVQ